MFLHEVYQTTSDYPPTIDEFKKDFKLTFLDKHFILQFLNYNSKSMQLVTFTIVITLSYVFT